MLDGMDADLAANLQKELEHLQIPVQATNAQNVGTTATPADGTAATEQPGATPTETTTPGSAPPPPGPDAPPLQDDPAKRKRNAVRYAKMNDLTASSVISMLKKIPREKIQADNDELASLIDAWEDFLLENTEFKLPGWVQLAMANLIIYGIKGFGQELMNMAGGFMGGKKAEPAEPAPQQRPAPAPDGNPPPTQQAPPPEVTIIRTAEPQGNTPQRSTAEVVPYVMVKKGAHKCELPGCNKQVPAKKKFCGHSHSTMWNNHIKRGIPIDPAKI